MAYSLAELRRDLSRKDTPPQRWLAGMRWRQANRAALAGSDPDPAGLRMVFAIPLISARKAADWQAVQENLAATLGSLRRQSDSRWIALVCCQERPETIAFDEQVRFLEFPHRPPRFDNHAKTAHVREWMAAKLRGAGYYFPLDADDLLHPGLVAHVLGDDNRGGYLVEKGYILDHAAMRLAVLQPPDDAYPEATHFFRSCGSSSALWFDFDSGADYVTALAARGNHRKVVRNMGYLGFRIAPVPFHAAIYVMNHGDNLRQKRGLMAGKMKHFDLNPVRDPAAQRAIGETFGLSELFPGRWPPPGDGAG
jgi:hypothetical protein